MKRFTLLLLFNLLFGLVLVGSAQREATLSGIINSDGEVPANTRVAVFTVDADNAWQRQVAHTTPVGGTFSLSLSPLEASELSAFRSGAVLFPGLTNEYTVAPEGVNFARAMVNLYVDTNGNEVFDGALTEPFFIGTATLEDPTGFFSLLYVDQAATLSGRGVTLELAPGWNIFTVSYPQGEDPVYEVSAATDRANLDVYLP